MVLPRHTINVRDSATLVTSLGLSLVARESIQGKGLLLQYCITF